MKNIITTKINKENKITHRIYSFVRRYRKLTFNQKNILQILWPNMGVDFTDQPLLFKSLFGNDFPVILEIGFGIGSSLVFMAKQNPEKNFLGIEVYMPGICNCLALAKEANLNNLRIIYYDIIEVLEKMLPNNSLNMVQLFFPDPWHKVKHNKRRIVQYSFVMLILSKLELNGIFHIATDCKSYAKHILNIMNNISDYKNLSETGDFINRPVTRPITKFEQRGQKLGNCIFDFMFKRIK
ncbi:MAG: tRNA (guanosine(46)-N7)-methyltransferase TrmB [Arsenophonus endosymbiont of Ceratovacuna japonica]